MGQEDKGTGGQGESPVNGQKLDWSGLLLEEKVPKADEVSWGQGKSQARTGRPRQQEGRGTLKKGRGDDIADCGLRILDFGFRIVGYGLRTRRQVRWDKGTRRRHE